MLGIKYVMSKTAQAAASIRSNASTPIDIQSEQGQTEEADETVSNCAEPVIQDKEQTIGSDVCLRMHARQVKHFHENHAELVKRLVSFHDSRKDQILILG